MIEPSFSLHWPWALLALPLPWLLPRWLPRAAGGPRAALWLPFYAQTPGLRRAERTVPAGALPWARLGWIALVLALSRPA